MHHLKALCEAVTFFLSALVLCIIFLIISTPCLLQVTYEGCVLKLRRVFYVKMS